MVDPGQAPILKTSRFAKCSKKCMRLKEQRAAEALFPLDPSLFEPEYQSSSALSFGNQW